MYMENDHPHMTKFLNLLKREKTEMVFMTKTFQYYFGYEKQVEYRNRKSTANGRYKQKAKRARRTFRSYDISLFPTRGVDVV